MSAETEKRGGSMAPANAPVPATSTVLPVPASAAAGPGPQSARIRLNAGGCGSLIIGGHDISDQVTRFSLYAEPGHMARLAVDFALRGVEVDAAAEITGELREAMIALGWTPPPDKET